MGIGLYGKLPSQGDFVSRRLPWDFTTAWDGWLQAGLAQARAEIGTRWNDTYLTAPLWRFQLAPGVVGPDAWIGLWFASVDRVGRQFPLTLAEPMPVQRQGRYQVIEQDAAFFALEDIALQGLDPRLGFDGFDRSISGMSVFDDHAGSVSVLVPQELPLQAVSISLDQLGARYLRLPLDADPAAALSAAQAAGSVASCFFTWGNEQHPPMLLRCEALPSEREFRGFLDGQWA